LSSVLGLWRRFAPSSWVAVCKKRQHGRSRSVAPPVRVEQSSYAAGPLGGSLKPKVRRAVPSFDAPRDVPLLLWIWGDWTVGPGRSAHCAANDQRQHGRSRNVAPLLYDGATGSNANGAHTLRSLPQKGRQAARGRLAALRGTQAREPHPRFATANRRAGAYAPALKHTSPWVLAWLRTRLLGLRPPCGGTLKATVTRDTRVWPTPSGRCREAQAGAAGRPAPTHRVERCAEQTTGRRQTRHQTSGPTEPGRAGRPAPRRWSAIEPGVFSG
jgi:hypothetical protein